MAKQGMSFQLSPSQLNAAVLEYARGMFAAAVYEIGAIIEGYPKITITVGKRRIRKPSAKAAPKAAT